MHSSCQSPQLLQDLKPIQSHQLFKIQNKCTIQTCQLFKTQNNCTI